MTELLRGAIKVVGGLFICISFDVKCLQRAGDTIYIVCAGQAYGFYWLHIQRVCLSVL